MPQGDRGQEVKDLQTWLNSRGANLQVDGIWGPLTEAAYNTYDGASFGTGSQATDADDGGARFADLPGRPEVWQNSDTGETFIVFMTPDVEPELPMLWKVSDPELLKAYFGDGAVTFDRVATTAQIGEGGTSGALHFGEADEIVLRGDNPFLNWADNMEAKKKVLPWFSDPEVAALWASAYLEDRPVTQEELAGTEWFYSKTQGEQQWLALLWSSPETAKQLEGSNRLAVRTLMEQAGINNPPDSAIDYIADKWTQGFWTDVDRNIQIALLADPAKQGDRDTGLLQAIGGTSVDTTTDKVRFVEQEAKRWLGPTYGTWDESQIATWAGKLRNDPDAADALQAELSRQRMAVMPGYENPDLTYEDIAQPWRNFVTNAWGQRADETDGFFQNILQLNDAGEASVLLRQEGLDRSIKQVEDDLMGSITSSFGGREGVRGIGAV